MKVKKDVLKNIIDVIKISNKADKSYFPLTIFKSIIVASFPFVAIIYSALILDGFIDELTKSEIMSYVYQMIIISSVLLVARTILTFLCEQKSNLIELRLNTEISKKTLDLDFGQLESKEVKDMISSADQGVRFTGGVGSFVNLFGAAIENFISLIYSFTLLIGLFVIADIDNPDRITQIFNSPLLGVGLICLVIISVLMNFKIISNVNKLHHDIFEENIYVNRLFLYLLESSMDYKLSKEVRLFHIDKLLSSKIADFSEKTANSYGRIFRKSGWMNARGGLLNNLIIYTAYIIVGIKALLGLISVGNVLLLVSAITAFNTAIVGLASNISNSVTLTKSLALYKKYLELKTVMYKGTLPIEKRDDGKYEFEFKNVTFHYPSSEEIILKNVSWKIKTGEKLAIVGPNGAGKSTFIKLLCRLYDPTEGEILLNGIDIKKYDYKEYVELMSIVFQDFKLFSTSIKENVTCDKNEEIDNVLEYLDKAGLKEFVEAQEKGLDTYLYSNFSKQGVEVSGGEAQKIAIARALYKDSAFVILDEPTSALDPISEYEIYTKFDKLVEGKTAIYISHRMSSCKFCDNIIVFDEGSIIESGNHKQLLKKQNGLYNEMWNAQAKYYNI